MYDFSHKTSPVFILTIFGMQSWERFLKDDCIRSSLIECQSFLNSKIDVDPIYCVLMSLPCIVQILCMTRYIQVDRIRILVTFVQRINKQKEYCLSVVQILTSKYQSRIDDRMQIDCTIRHGVCTGRSCSELPHCPVTKDQQDCVLNDLEELGDTRLFLKNQYSAGIFSCFLLLLPFFSSTFHQTNEGNTGNISEDFL